MKKNEKRSDQASKLAMKSIANDIDMDVHDGKEKSKSTSIKDYVDNKKVSGLVGKPAAKLDDQDAKEKAKSVVFEGDNDANEKVKSSYTRQASAGIAPTNILEQDEHHDGLCTKDRDSKAKAGLEQPQQLSSVPTAMSLRPGAYSVGLVGPLFADEEGDNDESLTNYSFGRQVDESSKRYDGDTSSKPFGNASSALVASCRNLFAHSNSIEEQEDEKKQCASPRYKVVGAGLCTLVLLVVIVISILLTGDNATDDSTSLGDTATENPTVSPGQVEDAALMVKCSTSDSELSQRYEDLRQKIVSNYPNSEAHLRIPESPARVGLCWLADVDDLQLEPTDSYQLIQRFTLATLAFSQPTSTISTGPFQDWVKATTICDWSHVRCTEDGTNTIEALLISDLDLSGRLPSEIAMLTSLLEIDISANYFDGEIPDELWEMQQLQQLIIGSNKFEGTISTRLLDMTELRKFHLSDNANLSGQLGDFSRLNKMQFFSVSNSPEISGTIPNLNQLTDLNQLQLTNSGISGTIPVSVGDLHNLKLLDLSQSQLTGTIPLEIGNATSIEELILHDNDLSGTIPSEIGLLDKLHLLDLSVLSELSGTIPTELGGLVNLEFFNVVYSTDLQGPMPSEMCLLQEESSNRLELFISCSGSPIACDCCTCRSN